MYLTRSSVYHNSDETINVVGKLRSAEYDFAIQVTINSTDAFLKIDCPLLKVQLR